MNQLAAQSGEKTLFGRTGGAATLAVGMSQIFSKVTNGRWLDLWYHFAVMFEALFILTTLDAGTRVGRYLLQDLLGSLWRPLGDTKKASANVFASALMVCCWGYFLIQGVRDPDGGIKALWPLFGIANQLLAAIALCLATTVILKMQLKDTTKAGRPAFMLVTLVPLMWLLTVTGTAGWQKIFHFESRANFPRIGFLQIAHELDDKLVTLQASVNTAQNGGEPKVLEAAQTAVRKNRLEHFNQMVDTAMVAIFLVLVTIIAAISFREWYMLLSRRHPADLHESEAVMLPDYAMAESRAVPVMGMVTLGFALAKELSGEAHIARAQETAVNCHCAQAGINLLGGKKPACGRTPEELYLEMTEKRFKGVNRCC
jgi:carbon starvation protein